MKMNWFRLHTLIVLPAVLVGIGYYLFNWYEVRPAKIKHDCSWTKVTEAEVPARTAITKEDVGKSEAEFEKCKQNYINKVNDPEVDVSSIATVACSRYRKIESPAMPAVPEKIYYKKSSDDEYYFCIHEQGL